MIVDSYVIKKEEEWAEILKYHNCPYYPRTPLADAETTYYNICEYFHNSKEKPKFLRNRSSKTIKLENQLAAKRRELETIDNLTKFERMMIQLDIAKIEKKLKVRRK